MPIPARMADRGDPKRTTVPSMRMVPASGRRTPESTFINVDFPEPFSPARAWTSPGRTTNVAPSLATTPG